MKIIFYIFVVLLLLQSNAFADFGLADSPQFYLNLLTERGNPSFDYCDSSNFSLNLLGIRRVYGDSDSFSFDWLANSQPISGPPKSPVTLPSGDLLEQYNSSTNQWGAFSSTPATGEAVIVLNHGWNSSPDTLLPLAQAISTRIPGIHIYTWHWGDGPDVVSEANPNGKSTAEDFAPLLNCLYSGMPFNDARKCLIAEILLTAELQKSMTNAAKQGGRLGDSLLSHGIRPDLHKIHLVGTSFGGVVCAEAARTLAKTGTKVKQITTLDTPALVFPYAVSYIKPEYAERVEVLYYDSTNVACLIRGATGGPITSASNVLNIKLNSWYYLTSWPLHFAVADWYAESAPASALNCESDPYGFGWSVSLNPTGWEWNNGPLGNDDETMGGKGCLTPLAELVAKEVTKAADKIKDDFSSAASYVGQKASLVLDNATNSVVALSLVSGSKMASGQFLAFDKLDSSSDLNDAYIYKEVNIPAGTDQVAFDVRFSAVGDGDKLTLSVGDEILIVVDACAVGVSDTYQTYYAYVGNYAGQTATIQIALRPSGTGQSVALIDNLRFTTLTLVEDITGDKAVDYADLSILAQNWLIVGCNFRNNCDGADIDRDNKVDFADFARLATYWLESF